jgi:hypothetical protein
MPAAIEPLSTNTLALMYFGDVVFAMSGALVAGRRRMDIVGFVLIGTITGVGGGTLRDLLLGRTVSMPPAGLSWRFLTRPYKLFFCKGSLSLPISA